MKQWLKSRFNYKEFAPNYSHVAKPVWYKQQKKSCLKLAIRITRDVQKNQKNDAHVCHKAYSEAFAKCHANVGSEMASIKQLYIKPAPH